MRPAQAREDATAATQARALGPAVQAVITSPQRKLALIDGKIVPLGGSVRDGTLVGVNESGAVLRKDGSLAVLPMHPDVRKTPARGDER